jgi:hypothetical protein
MATSARIKNNRIADTIAHVCYEAFAPCRSLPHVQPAA